MSSLDDRRQYPRVRVDGRMVGRATVLADFRVVSLSEVGALLEMAAPLALDSRCFLSLSLPHVSVDLQSKVVSVDAAETAEPCYRIGVSFVETDAVDQGLLQSYLDRERQRGEA